MTLEWSRLNATTVVGRLTASRDFRLVLETYFPSRSSWGSEGFYRLDEQDRAILGQRYFDQVFGPAAQFVVMADQPLLGSGTYPSLSRLQNDMRGSGKLASAAGVDGQITKNKPPAASKSKVRWTSRFMTPSFRLS